MPTVDFFVRPLIRLTEYDNSARSLFSRPEAVAFTDTKADEPVSAIIVPNGRFESDGNGPMVQIFASNAS